MSTRFALAAAVAVMFSAPAFAVGPTDCTFGPTGDIYGSDDCRGVYTSNFGNNLGAGNTTLMDLADAFGGIWALSVAELPFTGNPDSSGTITLDPAVDGPFAIALKAGSEQSGGGYSLYYFGPGHQDVSSLTYTAPPAGKNLSHASLYVSTSTPPVPEPETFALMAAGLLGIGLTARRRRAA